MRKNSQVKGEPMTAKDELTAFLLNLTDEQVDKLITALPKLTSLLEESSQPCPPAQTSQNQ